MTDYSLDLACVRSEWEPVYWEALRSTVSELLYPGAPFGPVEIILTSHAPAVTGTLTGFTDDSLFIENEQGTVEYAFDKIERFRA